MIKAVYFKLNGDKMLDQLLTICLNEEYDRMIHLGQTKTLFNIDCQIISQDRLNSSTVSDVNFIFSIIALIFQMSLIQYQENTSTQIVPVKFYGNYLLQVKQKEGRTLTNISKRSSWADQMHQPRECRICLEEEGKEQLCQPCKCTGSMSYSHQHCLREWITRLLTANHKTKAKCEVCEFPFEYQIERQRTFDLSQLRRHYQKNKSSFRWFFLIYFVLLAGFVGLMAILIMCYEGSAEGVIIRDVIMRFTNSSILYISIATLYFIGIFTITCLFISEYTVRHDITIGKIKNYKAIPRRTIKNYRIYPKK